MYRAQESANCSPEILQASKEFHDELQTNPQEIGGFSLPQFDNQVEIIRSTQAIDCPHGTLRNEIVEMCDGSIYPLIVGKPRNPKSDTAVTGTTAWLTHTRGHNMRTIRRMMKLGYPVVMVGSESEITNENMSVKDRFLLAMNNDLFKVSHDINQIVDVVLPKIDVRTDAKIGIGESRGGMLATGLKDLAYADLTDPCFARAPKTQELPRVAAQLMPEAWTLAKNGLKLALKPHGKFYHQTLHKNPEYYAKEIFNIPKLLSGQAGILAKILLESNPSINMRVKIFKGSGWAQYRDWLGIYADYPGVFVERSNGYHLDIARDDTLKGISSRLTNLKDQRGFDGSFDDIDYAQVHSANTN